MSDQRDASQVISSGSPSTGPPSADARSMPFVRGETPAMMAGIPAAALAPTADDQATRLRGLVEGALVEGKETPGLSLFQEHVPELPPADQREVLPPAHAERPAPQHHRAPILAIASGKGGVGKTTLSVNIAQALGMRGVRVLLIDADMGVADADVLAGVAPKHDLGMVMDGSVRIDDALVEAGQGFTLLAGVSGDTRCADLIGGERDLFKHVLANARRRADLVMLDCGAGVGSAVRTCAGLADHTAVITSPDPHAIADTYAFIKCTWGAIPHGSGASAGPSMGVVVNMAQSKEQAEAVHARIDSVSKRFLSLPVPGNGWVRSDSAVSRALFDRKPVVVLRAGAKPAHDIHRVAEMLAALVGVHADPLPAQGLMAGGLMGSSLMARIVRKVPGASAAPLSGHAHKE